MAVMALTPVRGRDFLMFSILLSWTLFYSCCFWSMCISFSCRCQKVSKGLFSVVKKLLLFWSFWSHHMTLMIEVLKWTSSGSPYLPLPTSGWGQIRDVDIKHEHSPNNEVSVWAKFSVCPEQFSFSYSWIRRCQMDNKHKPLRGAAKKKILVSDESLLLKLL